MRKFSLHILAAALLLAVPSIAIADGVITVSDTVAGLGTSVELTGSFPSTTVSLHVVSESGEDTAIPATTDAKGNATVSIPEKLTVEAGTYRVFAILGNRKIATDATFDVLHDRVNQRGSQLSVSNSVITADGRSLATVTVILRDAQGNPLPGRPVQLVGSRAEDRITPLIATRETDLTGAVQFAVQTQTPGDIALRAMDLLSGTMLSQIAHITAQWNSPVGGFENAGTVTSGTLTAQLAPPAPVLGDTQTPKAYDVPSKILISAPSTAAVKDILPNVTITVVDANGNAVESFAGKLHIETPSDNGATLPGLGLSPGKGEFMMTKKGLGKAILAWSIAFSKSGQQTIVVTDDSGTLRGEVTVTVTGTTEIPDNMKIRMETPRDGDTVNTREILIKGRDKKLALRNLHVFVADASASKESLTTGVPSIGDANADGLFAFTAKLPAGSQSVMLELQDESGQYDSGVIHLTIDTQGPALQYTFDPEQPSQGQDVTLTVKSEPGLPEVTFKLGDQNLSLTEGSPGVYSVLFVAPDSGMVDYTLSGRDTSGNITDIPGQMVILGPILPQVQNVRAEGLARAIQVDWDMIPDDAITGYRIEVGKGPGRSDITLDTPGPTESSAVAGPEIKAGTTYFVTVRVLRGNDVGPRSAVVTVKTLGIEITVTPQEGSLMLQWTYPDTTTLDSFLLEYGGPEGDFSEQRSLAGGMRVYTMKDLRDDQLYLIRLTPIATTGEILHDLTATAQGTPLRTLAFHASPDELSHHVNPDNVSPDNALHAGAPDVPHSGLPSLPIRPILGVTVVVGGVYWYRRKRAMSRTRNFLNQMQRRYHP